MIRTIMHRTLPLTILCFSVLMLSLQAEEPPKSVEWEKIISHDVLLAEIHSTLVRLETLAAAQEPDAKIARSVNRDAATLAALAEIAAAHPQRKRRSGRTPALRRASQRLLALTDKTPTEISAALPRIIQECRASLTANESKNAQPVHRPQPISEAVDRGGLMWRMDYALRWVKDNVRQREDFERHGELARHEAAVLKAVAHLIGHPGYGSSEEAQFQQLQADLLDHSGSIQEHLQAKNLAKLQAALSAARGGCINCHKKYRN